MDKYIFIYLYIPEQVLPYKTYEAEMHLVASYISEKYDWVTSTMIEAFAEKMQKEHPSYNAKLIKVSARNAAEAVKAAFTKI